MKHICTQTKHAVELHRPISPSRYILYWNLYSIYRPLLQRFKIEGWCFILHFVKDSKWQKKDKLTGIQDFLFSERLRLCNDYKGILSYSERCRCSERSCAAVCWVLCKVHYDIFFKKKHWKYHLYPEERKFIFIKKKKIDKKIVWKIKNKENTPKQNVTIKWW